MRRAALRCERGFFVRPRDKLYPPNVSRMAECGRLRITTRICFRQLDLAHFDALNWPTPGDIDSCTATRAVRW